MTDPRKISIAITSFNRVERTIKSFEKVLHDDRVEEIVIVDDFSDFDKYSNLVLRINDLHCDKIKLYRNEENKGCYENKKIAVEKCGVSWVILFDSDNVIDKSYIDKIYEMAYWLTKVIYSPDFAKPHFDFRHISGVTIDKSNAKQYTRKKQVDCLLNLANNFFYKDTYLDAWDGSFNPIGADSIYMNLNLLKKGNRIHVVKGLEYLHPISSDSNYNAFAKDSVPLCERFLKEIENL